MYHVDGFLFEDDETAKLAKKEEENIRYIKEHTALDNTEIVFKLYKKLLEQNLLVTPVGIRFLLELQNILLGSPQIARKDIPPILVSQMVVKKEVEEESASAKVKKVTKKVEDKVKGNYKKPFYIALFFAIVFAFSVVGMFVITKVSGNNVNILNYRNEVLDEYSSWEEELKTKEAQLKELEKELEKKGK